MCIYCGTQYHRLIYENHFGPIPKDEEGRSYEIHHVDGNHNNNELSNLTCVTIKEHYAIHLEQGDHKACLIMAARMQISPEEKSRLAKLSNTGERNPMYGTIWITDDISNKKIQQDDEIPIGWRKGRFFPPEHAVNFNKRDQSGSNNARYNRTEYHFKNTVTGEEVNCTPLNFSTQYNINIRKVRGLFKKRISIVNDWVIA